MRRGESFESLEYFIDSARRSMQEFPLEPSHLWRFVTGHRDRRRVMTLPFGQNRTTSKVSEVIGLPLRVAG